MTRITVTTTFALIVKSPCSDRDVCFTLNLGENVLFCHYGVATFQISRGKDNPQRHPFVHPREVRGDNTSAINGPLPMLFFPI